MNIIFYFTLFALAPMSIYQVFNVSLCLVSHAGKHGPLWDMFLTLEWNFLHLYCITWFIYVYCCNEFQWQYWIFSHRKDLPLEYLRYNSTSSCFVDINFQLEWYNHKQISVCKLSIYGIWITSVVNQNVRNCVTINTEKFGFVNITCYRPM